MRAFPGEFYFKLTSFGNLLGEFTNRCETGMCTESSVPLAGEQATGNFTGTYNTTWYDAESGEADHAVLIIAKEKRKVANRYKLVWTNRNGDEIRFHGYGFVCNEMLIGHYVDGEPKE